MTPTFLPPCKPCAAIREPEPDVWLGGPREPVAFLQVRRPIVIPEAVTVKAAPGLWVTK